MNEWDDLSEQERDFINYLREKRGPCPDDEALVAFRQQELAPERTQEVEAHVRLCGTCQLALQMLERFEQCEAGEWPEPPDWPEAQRRGRKRFAEFIESIKSVESIGSIEPIGSVESVDSAARRAVSRESKSPFWDKLGGVLLHPAVAYVLLAALAYPAYQGLFREPEVVTKMVPQKEIVEVQKPALNIASLSTFTLKSPERAASQESQVVRLGRKETFFALSFFVPISESPEFVYDLEIYDGQDQVVAMEKTARPQDRLGNFLLVCRRDLFSAGKYELRVEEVDKMTQEVERKFSFPFTLSEMK